MKLGFFLNKILIVVSVLSLCACGGGTSANKQASSEAAALSSISAVSSEEAQQSKPASSSSSITSSSKLSSSLISASVSVISSVNSSSSIKSSSNSSLNSSQNAVSSVNDALRDISLKSQITKVQPMTGIVLWTDSYNDTVLKTDNQYIQLEFVYVRPSDVVIGDNLYDWSALENILEDVRKRGKQAILRWYYVYPGKETAVPNYIKNYSDYHETSELSEGEMTGFPDWSHPELQQAHLDFYTAFAQIYDRDPRIAFLQVGFGLWGEYHIYDPKVILGKNFPSKTYQKTFLLHMDKVFNELHWSISIDAGDSSNTPIADDSELSALHFGNFDDSFMQKDHADYNADMWRVFNHSTRYQHSPHGGELSYYSDYDQKNALNSAGMYGRTYEKLSRDFNITYMIGNDQPEYQSNERIKQAGMANGYKFHITSFKASQSRSVVAVENSGIAPIYYDAYVAINGVRSSQTLKGLLPSQSLSVEINSGGDNPVLTIESDRLVAGQEIQFEADL